jgi:hypothetical protein
MSAEIKSYDRQAGETEKAYAAFVIYRDLGSDRSLEKTAEFYYPAQVAHKVRHPNIRRIQDWSAKYRWSARVLDYDRDEEAIARERKRDLNRAEHDAKLEHFRQNNEELGSEMTGLSKELTSFFRSSLASTVEVFKTPISDDENPEREVKLAKARQSQLGQLFTVSQICKNATAFATTGEDLTADGLLIRQMLEKMKGEGE